VYVVVQLAVDELTVDRLHGVGSNESPPEEDEKPTVPVGVDAVPPSVSVTVAVHVVPTARSTVGAQEIAVLVVRVSTVSVVEPLLVAWVASPP
jgi:hypothetical protein